MPGASDALTDQGLTTEQKKQVKKLISEAKWPSLKDPTPEETYKDPYNRETAIKHAVTLMVSPVYGPLLNSSILANLEHISNQILNYMAYGKFNPETKA